MNRNYWAFVAGVLFFFSGENFGQSLQLTTTERFGGNIKFTLNGPLRNYSVFRSTNLVDWAELAQVTNASGTVVFSDAAGGVGAGKFYRARTQVALTNMVFVPPNTFQMGSRSTEQDRQSNEGPQMSVTLTHGYWIAKYEVTQAEYLDVTGTNPSYFLGDLSRPVSSVSWPAATNYCAKLTEREIATGRIPPGSMYRLPTEAEWECAARAGTTTRFFYGDDPTNASVTNYAWIYVNTDLTSFPVGQKLPNPWGLYDIMGNVFEWCSDWYGPYPGGAQVDPAGAPSNAIGFKVMRGGGYDYFYESCRSAARLFFGNHEALTDTDLGIRVVLVMAP
jgi:formylglycine-generating enzyme required for sulfatase activity